MADDSRILGAWCSDCRATATRQCWAKHEVHNTKAAMRRHLQGALSEAAGLLEGLQDQVQGEQALQALALLSGESWGLTLRGGDQVLTGTVRNTEDPLVKALWVVVAARAALVQHPGAAAGPPATPGPSTAGARPVSLEADEGAISQTVKTEELEENRPAHLPSSGRVEVEATWREMNVHRFSSGYELMTEGKAAALLQEAKGVQRLSGLNFNFHPQWSFQLLQAAAPTVEHLSVENSNPTHMLAIHTTMPRLTRLQILGRDLVTVGLVLPELSPGHCGLQWLRVDTVPGDTLKSLLRAHADSLVELQLGLGVARAASARDIESMALKKCGLPALRRVVLQRGSLALNKCGQHKFTRIVLGREAYHDREVCAEKLAAMRRMLPDTQVLCQICDDNVEREPF